MASELLFCDTETGGLDPQRCALLSIGLVHWKDGRLLEREEILVQPEGLDVESEALRVNRIDMARHRQVASSRRVAAAKMYHFIQSYLPSFNEQNRLILAGHNVAFDIAFVKPLFGDYWRRMVLHRSVDTSSILQFMVDSGYLSAGSEVSLDRALKHYRIEIPSELRHTALADAVGTALLYTAMVDRLEDVQRTAYER